MKTNELREAYLSFFESKGCVRRPSDLLVPPNDNSVLFTPAGMNQFKEEFLGIKPLEYTRATTCQKCIRTGDIENVGKTPFHMTFFEMLGNFSFGDYFKKEAIHWGYEFVVKVLGIKQERLRVSVYLDDDEAFNIWNKEIKLPADRIRRCGEDDNFWPAGAPTNGPDGVCGPCSEIFIDLGNGNEVEIWNLVFTQFNRVGVKKLEPLPKKNIDTGMGLERTASVLQGVSTAFDTDIFKPIVAAASELVGVKYDPSTPAARRLRRIAEHVRTVTFCMHENVLPDNKQQGYVVRRLLRRAILDAYQLGRRDPVLFEVVPAVVEAMKTAYPDIVETQVAVSSHMKLEEEQFLANVDRGTAFIEGLFKRLESAGEDTISGREAHELWSTHGFPVELTEELAAARNVKVDRVGFAEAEEKHATISKNTKISKDVFAVGPLQKLKSFVSPTEFVGYDQVSAAAKIKAVIAEGQLVDGVVEVGHKDEITIILDRTPFYGESGGQIGDLGTITGPGGMLFEVTDTQKTDNYYQHIGHVKKGSAKVGMEVTATIDAGRRAAVQRAHSATHILHAGLHKVLGEHAKQAGSKVEPDLLRFDFSNPQAVSADDLAAIEKYAAEKIMSAAKVSWEVKPIEEARKMGAMALFGEKYGDKVRVVSMGDFSREFCGGCHLSNTGQVGPIKIIREESVSAGTRRITALTGQAAIEHFRSQEKLLAEAAARAKAQPSELPKKIEALQNEIKELQKKIAQKKQASTGDLIGDLLNGATSVGDSKVIAAEVEGVSAAELREHSDQLRSRAKSLAVLLASKEGDGKVNLIAAVSQDLVDRGMHAGDWIKEIAAMVGGKGGGKPNMAQAGGKDPARLAEAIERAVAFASAKLQA